MTCNYLNIRAIRLLIFFVSLFCLINPPLLPAVEEEDLQTALLEQLEYEPAKRLGLEGHGMDSASIDRALSDIYHENSLQPFWVDGKGPGERAEIIYETVKDARTEGLDPERYRLEKIEQYWESTDPVGLARLDILLTLALGGYVADVREGRLNPRKVDPKLFASARDVDVDPVELVGQAMTAQNLKQYLNDQGPSHYRYDKLRKALAKYRHIASQGGWGSVPDGETLKAGMTDERIPLIRERLFLTKDSQSDDFSSNLYDEDLALAVKNFQHRHGLAEDGVIGKRTLRAMNVSVEAHIRLIEMNMERSRWISHELGDVRVGVTIAGFQLGVFNNAQLETSMPVIVGKKYHMTPVFSDMIKYIEFNPYWNITPSIARNEMLPKLKKNPHYLKERNIRVFSSWGEDAKELDSTTMDWNEVGRDIVRYRLRQDPGPDNALGRVKFMFPNKYSVYLHDTPSHNLFERAERTFSHGCIRVSRPLELASHLLGGEENGWGMDRINKIIESGKRTVVPLKKHIPVHITYRTVWIGDDEAVHFSKDVYGRDKLLEKALYDNSLL